MNWRLAHATLARSFRFPVITVLLATLALGVVLLCVAQAGTTFAGNAPAGSEAPGAISLTDATGACCLVDGTCGQMSQGDCHAFGGSYHGDGTICSQIECGGSPVGACCLGDGSCLHKTQVSCQSVGGTY